MSKKQDYISQKIKKLKEEGKSQRQAVAQALSMAEDKYSTGGKKELPKYQEGVNFNINPNPSPFDTSEYYRFYNPNTSQYNIDPNLGNVQNQFQVGYQPQDYPQQTREQIEPLFNRGSLSMQSTQPLVDTEQELQNSTTPTNKQSEKNPFPQYQVQNPNRQSYFNPYAGIDIPTAAAYFGQSLERGDTSGTVASGFKLGTGLARNVFGAMGAERRNQQVQQQYREDQRDYITGANRPVYGEDGGKMEIPPFDVYQNGGRKQEQLPQEKVMTGEYMTGISGSNQQLEANAELEDDEYILTNDGQSIKVEGKTHEQGGEEVRLEDGDMVISDNLKLTGKYAKKLRDQYNVKVKAKDTFASAVDKVYREIGLQKIIDKEEKVSKRIIEEEKNTEDATTKNLNLQFLYKEKNKIEEEKSKLEPQRKKALKDIFDMQEESKPKENKNSNEMEDGGKKKYQDGGERQERFTNWINNLRAIGYDREYDPNKPIEEQVGAAQQWLAANRPEVVQSYFQNQPITTKGYEQILSENEGVLEQAGVDKPERFSDLTEQQKMAIQNAYRDTVDENTYNQFLLDQFQDDLFAYRAPLVSVRSNMTPQDYNQGINAPIYSGDNQPANQVGTRTQDSTEIEEPAVEGEMDVQQRRSSLIPLSPDQSAMPPGGLDPSLKVNRRYDRLTPYEISPEQAIVENQRQSQAAYQAATSLPDSQRAAAIAQISSNTQNANQRAITQAEMQNAQIANQIANQNARIQAREDDMAAQDALSYEQRTQTAQAITEEQRQQYLDYMRRLNTSRFNDIRRMNTVNQIFPNYNIDTLGNIQTQNNYRPDLMGMVQRGQMIPSMSTNQNQE